MPPVKPEWADHFKLTTEDYLHSVISLVNELVSILSFLFVSIALDRSLTNIIILYLSPRKQARLCPNSIVNSDFELPLRISKFSKEIHAGFGLLNLKNDSLRKRFDGMKYDIKKMEEVVYDISLRGLVKKTDSTGTVEKKDDDSMKVEAAASSTGDVDMPNAKRVRDLAR
jgi:hypothetical protein